MPFPIREMEMIVFMRAWDSPTHTYLIRTSNIEEIFSIEHGMVLLLTCKRVLWGSIGHVLESVVSHADVGQ